MKSSLVITVLGLSLAACGGASPRTVTTTGNGTGLVTGAPYLDVFVAGRSWTYAAEQTSSMNDPDDPAADATGMVRTSTTGTLTCTVGAVETVGAATVAEVTCTDPPGTSVPISTPAGGVFAMTSAGLWVLSARPTSDAELTADTMAMAATPAPMSHKFEEPDGSAGWSIETKAGDDGAWCVTSSSWSGDDGGTQHCFAAGVGIVSGAAFFGGGMTVDLAYKLAP